MKKIIISCILAITFFSCNTSTPSIPSHKKPTSSSQDFWNELKKHCGKTYEGKITEGGKEGDGFTGEKLIMHVRSCEENEIHIPFNVGENLSRTWILKKDSKGLIQLKHDHRKEDGSNDEITMYGGKSSNQGSKSLQVFPADEETRNHIAYAASNVWWITLDENTFTYNLRRIGTPRVFSVSFNLNEVKPTPKASWGW